MKNKKSNKKVVKKVIAPKVEIAPLSVSKIEGLTPKQIEGVIEELNSRKIKRSAKRPGGKVLWIHIVGISDELKDAIQKYRTLNPNYSIHNCFEIAISKMLNVPLRDKMEDVLPYKKQ